MDEQFVKKSIKALLPISIICSLLYITAHYDSDYFWHISYDGNGTYPPLLARILAPFGDFKSQALFTLNLLSSIYIPFMLIERIKGFDAARFYLLSGIPILSFVLWVVPQSIIFCLMLASIWFPPFLFSFLIMGAALHSFWFAAFLLTIGFVLWRNTHGH
jgi:hypothetical protein